MQWFHVLKNNPILKWSLWTPWDVTLMTKSINCVIREVENSRKTGIEGPAEGEPHVCVLVKRDLQFRIHERKIFPIHG